jgi:hypothetical protein
MDGILRAAGRFRQWGRCDRSNGRDHARRRPVAVALSVLVATASCGIAAQGDAARPAESSVESEPVPAATSAPATPDASESELYGRYLVSLDEPGAPPGRWQLNLEPGSYWMTVSTSGQVNRGQLAVTGDEIVFTNETPRCVDDIGRYRWELTSGSLRFTVIGEDTCSQGARTVVLTTDAWTRQE